MDSDLLTRGCELGFIDLEGLEHRGIPDFAERFLTGCTGEDQGEKSDARRATLRDWFQAAW